MLDAVALADLLRDTDLTDSGRLARVLDHYTQVRKPEAETLQKASWTIGNISSWDSPLMARARDIIMRTVAGRKQIAGIRAQFAEAAAMSGAVGGAS